MNLTELKITSQGRRVLTVLSAALAVIGVSIVGAQAASADVSNYYGARGTDRTPPPVGRGQAERSFGARRRPV